MSDNLPPGVTQAMIDDHLDPAVCVECRVADALDRACEILEQFDAPEMRCKGILDDLATTIRDAIADNGWRTRACDVHAVVEDDDE